MTTPKSRKMRTRVCSRCGHSEVLRADNRSEICRSCATKKQHENNPANVKHGYYGTNLYFIWQQMISRCHHTTNKDYPKYGGRGIEVCPEWKNSFEKFLEDMGDRVARQHLHRKDNDRGYSAENCEWVSPAQHNKIHSALASVTFVVGVIKCLI